MKLGVSLLVMSLLFPTLVCAHEPAPALATFTFRVAWQNVTILFVSTQKTFGESSKDPESWGVFVTPTSRGQFEVLINGWWQEVPAKTFFQVPAQPSYQLRLTTFERTVHEIQLELPTIHCRSITC